MSSIRCRWFFYVIIWWSHWLTVNKNTQKITSQMKYIMFLNNVRFLIIHLIRSPLRAVRRKIRSMAMNTCSKTWRKPQKGWARATSRQTVPTSTMLLQEGASRTALEPHLSEAETWRLSCVGGGKGLSALRAGEPVTFCGDLSCYRNSLN